MTCVGTLLVWLAIYAHPSLELSTLVRSVPEQMVQELLAEEHILADVNLCTEKARACVGIF